MLRPLGSVEPAEDTLRVGLRLIPTRLPSALWLLNLLVLRGLGLGLLNLRGSGLMLLHREHLLLHLYLLLHHPSLLSRLFSTRPGVCGSALLIRSKIDQSRSAD